MMRTWIGALALAALCLACDDNESVVAGDPAPSAFLRVAHLSPDAPNVDVWLDGAPVDALRNVPYKAVSGYLPVPEGTRRVQVFATGTTTGAVIDAPVPLSAGVSYTVAAVDFVASIAPLVLVDDRTPSTNPEIRFVHASPNAPAVDITVAGGAPVLFDAVTFRGTDRREDIAAGTYDLEVRLDADDSLVLALPGIMVSGGTNYTVFAVGSATGAPQPLEALIAVDN